MSSRRAAKTSPKDKIKGGSVKRGFRDKKIAGAVKEAVAFLLGLSESGLADPSVAAVHVRDLSLAEIQIFLFLVANNSAIPNAVREKARAMAETARHLAGRLPIYEVPPAIRMKARRLALALDAATKRGTGSSTLTPGDASRIVSVIDRKMKGNIRLHKAAESIAERFCLSTSRIEQIYRQHKRRLKQTTI